MKAVVVLSGGLDSTTCMGIAQDQGYELYPITFFYGQRHDREIEQAKQVAKHYGVSMRHHIVPIPQLGALGGSSLTDHELAIPMNTEEDEIPSTYVPARNLIFLSLATAFAEVVDAERIFLGVSAIDYSGYPDCRPEFIEAMNRTIALGTKAGVEGEQAIQIETPLSHLSKAETIQKGLELGVPYQLTTSCYVGEDEACGQCDSCRFRLQGFAVNGVKDPIAYKEGISSDSR